MQKIRSQSISGRVGILCYHSVVKLGKSRTNISKHHTDPHLYRRNDRILSTFHADIRAHAAIKRGTYPAT